MTSLTVGQLRFRDGVKVFEITFAVQVVMVVVFDPFLDLARISEMEHMAQSIQPMEGDVLGFGRQKESPLKASFSYR